MSTIVDAASRPAVTGAGDRRAAANVRPRSCSTSAPTTRPRSTPYRRLGYAEYTRFEERLIHRLGSPWPELAARMQPPLRPQGDPDLMTSTSARPAHDVTDLGLAAEGVRRIEWAEREMPVPAPHPRALRARPPARRACASARASTSRPRRQPDAHAQAGGAEVVLAASNPLSTKDDVAAALVAEYGIATFARRGEDRDTYYAHLNAVADTHPQLTMDDGCDLVSLLHSERPEQVKEVLAGTEETTTGVIRLKAMAADGALGFPVIAVNEAQTKHLFDNRYGTGQSTVDGILRARTSSSRAQGRHRRLRLGGAGDRLADGRPRAPTSPSSRSIRSARSRR
jgi:hypothetical protein